MKKLVRSYFAHYILPKTVTSLETPTKSELPLKITFMDQMKLERVLSPICSSLTKQNQKI